MISACQPSTPPAQRLLDNISAQVILPTHQQFADSTLALKQSSERFCKQPDNKLWLQTREHWKTAMMDWQAVKLFQFGPIIHDNQHWKIQFWPDKHNLIRKKINALLSSSETIDAAKIKNTSVVIQGLSALEFLLFDKKGGQQTLYTDDSNKRRCQLLMTIAAHTQQVAEQLNSQWQPTGSNYAATFSNPGASNDEYPTTEAAIAALVDSLVANLESAKREQLGNPMGYQDKNGTLVKRKPRRYLTQAWRSRLSAKLLRMQLQAAARLFNGSAINSEDQYGFKQYLNGQPETSALADQIDQQFQRIDTQLSAMEQPLFDALAELPSPQLHAIYVQVTVLVQLFKNQLPAAMGVTLGFNANDGD